jgi:NADPH:quinone reductase
MNVMDPPQRCCAAPTSSGRTGLGEVRVRVEVSGVNPTDWKLRIGATPRAIDRFQIPHHDAAGVIDAVGAGVSRERLGQRVARSSVRAASAVTPAGR